MTFGRCRCCDRRQPGPLPKYAIARLNAAKSRTFVVRVLRGTRLHVAQVTDFCCAVCCALYTRKAMVV